MFWIWGFELIWIVVFAFVSHCKRQMIGGVFWLWLVIDLCHLDFLQCLHGSHHFRRDKTIKRTKQLMIQIWLNGWVSNHFWVRKDFVAYTNLWHRYFRRQHIGIGRSMLNRSFLRGRFSAISLTDERSFRLWFTNFKMNWMASNGFGVHRDFWGESWGWIFRWVGYLAWKLKSGKQNMC